MCDEVSKDRAGYEEPNRVDAQYRDSIEADFSNQSKDKEIEKRLKNLESQLRKNSAGSRSISRKDFITVAIAILGVLLGAIGLFQNERQNRKYVRIEANQLLAEA